jgi:hypothetical protein
MVLSLRRTPLERAPAMAHLEDWQVLDDGKPVGRLYQAHTAAPPEIIWHWSLTEYVEPRSGLRTSGTARREGGVPEYSGQMADWATQAGFDSSSG